MGEENEYLRQSKLALIKATAMEIERLRQFISLLANALRAKGFTNANIRNIQFKASKLVESKSTYNKNKRFPQQKQNKPQREWAYKQKQKEISKQKSEPSISALIDTSDNNSS